MKKVLIIGASMPDILLQNGAEVGRNVGGCAANIADTVRHFRVPYTFFSPIGTGEFGDFVREGLEARGIFSPVSVTGEHGCCFCYLEPAGNRYRSQRGSEYDFTAQLLEGIDADQYSAVCIPGIELKTSCGDVLVDWLEQHRDLPLVYAPGRHLPGTPPERAKRILALKPQIHLNDEEICALTGAETPEAGAEALFALTGSPVWVTCGPAGSICRDNGGLHRAPAEPVAAVVDTVGAGDSHLGAILAGQALGLDADRCLRLGSRIARALVQNRGSLLPDEDFEKLDFEDITEDRT